MKTAVSIPDPLYDEAEAAAKDLGMSRSKLIQVALEEFLRRRRNDDVTRQLNESYTKNPPEPDPFLDHLALEGVKRTEWKE